MLIRQGSMLILRLKCTYVERCGGEDHVSVFFRLDSSNVLETMADVRVHIMQPTDTQRITICTLYSSQVRRV